MEISLGGEEYMGPPVAPSSLPGSVYIRVATGLYGRVFKSEFS